MEAGVAPRLLIAASLACLGAALAGCGSGSDSSGAQKKPAELVLTAKDVGAPQTSDTGPTDLYDEAPEGFFKALRAAHVHGGTPSPAFGTAYQSVSVDALAVTVPSEDDAKRLLEAAPRLARFEGMGGGKVVGSLPIGDAAVLMHGGILTPAGQPEQGAAVVFREGNVVGQVIAETDADAIRLAKIQAAKAG